MPKLGMRPVRQGQIRRAASTLIARNGFNATTLRDVAVAADVSKGTIHHYYTNKLEMLKDTLVYVSESNLARLEDAIAEAPAGEPKLRALIGSSIRRETEEAREAQAIWIWAVAEALRSPDVQVVVQERRAVFQALIQGVLHQLNGGDRCPALALRALATQLDAILNGIETHKVSGAVGLDPARAEEMLLMTVREQIRAIAAPGGLA